MEDDLKPHDRTSDSIERDLGESTHDDIFEQLKDESMVESNHFHEDEDNGNTEE